MAKINWSRVFLGGLAAGVVLIALAIVLSALLIDREEIRSAILAFDQPHLGRRVLPVLLAVGYLFLGILMTWWYAAIRPRFGAGPKTAAIAGFAVWLTANPVQSVIIGRVGQLRPGFILKTMLIYLVIMTVSAIAGAWIYKE